jgi:hypothetical protein
MTDENTSRPEIPSLADVQPLLSASAGAVVLHKDFVQRLIDIARTALELRAQEKTAAKARYLVNELVNKDADPSDSNVADSYDQDGKLIRCRRAFISALDKVRP